MFPPLGHYVETRMSRFHQTVICLALAIGFFAAAAPAHAQDTLLGDAKRVPGRIHKVDAGGYWARDKQEGFFRVVVVAAGVEHVVHRIYLQWLTIDPDSQDYRLVGTTPVKELNEGHGSVLDVKTEYPDLGRLRVTINASPRGGGPVKRFVLTAKGDGTYTLRSP
jgi:hypothetical protein